jgi:integrase
VLTEAEIARLWTAYQQLEQDATAGADAQLRRARHRAAPRRPRKSNGSGGELLALRWRDIQLLDGRLQVREALVKGRFTTPKSRAGRRMIELGPRTKQLLAEHWQRSRYQGDDELVFTP